MLKMLKNQILWVAIALSLLFCVAAEATTIARPFGSAAYPAGAKAIGPNVDADFNNIVSWLNGGNIATGNIASFGVVSGNIANGAVGSSQIATNGVSPQNLSLPNIAITGSSSTFQISSVTPGLITNLSTTFTASGVRPVRVWLEPAPATYLFNGSQVFGSYVEDSHLSNGSATDAFFFVRSNATTAHFQTSGGATSATIYPRNCSDFSYTELPAAGTYTYSAEASVSNVSNTMLFFNCRLVVEEY